MADKAPHLQHAPNSEFHSALLRRLPMTLEYDLKSWTIDDDHLRAVHAAFCCFRHFAQRAF
jgi:hypothetical protein